MKHSPTDSYLLFSLGVANRAVLDSYSIIPIRMYNHGMPNQLEILKAN